MAIAQIRGVRIAGIASAVPENTENVTDVAAIFGAEEAERIAASIGVRKRHLGSGVICTSDLCFASAQKLLAELDWDPASVGLLIFITQTPDYSMPATACILQHRLGLSKQCAAFDVNLGCSGFTYGLWMASKLMESGTVGRALLLVGDTATFAAKRDRSVAALFGDGGAAAALECVADAAGMSIVLGTDGSGCSHLMVPAGRIRNPSTAATRTATERESGNVRSDEDLYMNGAEVFSFTIREIPTLIRSVLDLSGWPADSVNAFVLHQANRFMLEYLGKRMKIPTDKLILALDQFGNTSSASIPLAMTHTLRERLRRESLRLVLAGFGVGYSWAAVAVDCGPMVMPELVVLDRPLLAEAS